MPRFRMLTSAKVVKADSAGEEKLNMLIRKAIKEDIPKVAEIYEAIHDGEANGKFHTGWMPGVYPVRETAEVALERGELFVAEREGKIVGSAKINDLQEECYYSMPWMYPAEDGEVLVIHTLVVNPECNNIGVGGALLEYYEAMAREQGKKVLRLDTQERNVRARAFYRKRGYREIGIAGCVFNGIPNVRLVMLEKKI